MLVEPVGFVRCEMWQNWWQNFREFSPKYADWQKITEVFILKKIARLVMAMALVIALAASSVTALAGAGGGGTGVIPPPAPPRVEGIPDVEVPEGYVAFYDFRGDVVITVENPTRVAVFDDGILALMMGVGLDVLGIEVIGFAQRNLDNLGWREFGNATPVPSGTLFMHDVEPLVSVAPQLFMTGARSFGMCRYYTGVAQPRFNANTPDFGYGTREEQTQALWDALLEVEPDMAVAHMTVNMAAANLRTDMRVNVDILARIFPNAANALRSQFAQIESQLDEIKGFVQGEGLNAVIFRVTGTAHIGSAFGYNTRWSFIYDEFGFEAALPTGWPYSPAQMTERAEAEGLTLFDIQVQTLLEVNPDVIFFVDSTEGETGYGEAFEQLMANSYIQQTQAYENGFIIAGLPNTEWYTTVGGFPSIQRMIDDVNRFITLYRASEAQATTPQPPVPAPAPQPPAATANVDFSSLPTRTVDGVNFVQFRAAAAAHGVEGALSWNGANQSVTLSSPQFATSFVVASVGGFIHNGRTYVPIQFAMDVFG